MKKQDKWCMPLKRTGKSTISGGAARNVRIAKSGGMDSIVTNAVDFALNQANLMSGSIPDRPPLQPKGADRPPLKPKGTDRRPLKPKGTDRRPLQPKDTGGNRPLH